MTSDVERLFMYLLTFSVCSLEDYLFRSFVYVLIELFVGFYAIESYWVLYVFQILILYQICGLQLFFPHCVSCLFTVLMTSSAVQKLLVFCSPACLFVLRLFMLQMSYPKNHHQNPCQEALFQFLLQVSSLPFKSLTHSKLIFLSLKFDALQKHHLWIDWCLSLPHHCPTVGPLPPFQQHFPHLRGSCHFTNSLTSTPLPAVHGCWDLLRGDLQAAPMSDGNVFLFVCFNSFVSSGISNDLSVD